MKNTTQTQELWMRELTEFKMSDGTTINGFRINYVRDLEEDETLDDIDEDKEFDDVVGGSIVPNNVDRNFDPIDDDEIVDEDIEMFSPYFYIGDGEGRPIE